MSQEPRQRRAPRKPNRTPAATAATYIAGWAVVLLSLLLSSSIHWLTGLAALWLAYNFVSWLVPNWRLAILGRRGSTVGLGFAIAGGLVTALAVAHRLTLAQLLGTVALNTLLLFLPFIAVRLFKLPACRPHRADLLLAAYTLGIAFFWPVDALIVTASTVRLGGFVALASAVTVYLASRFWNRSKWDLDIDKKYRVQTGGAAAIVVAAALLDSLIGFGGTAVTWLDTLYRGAILAPLSSLLVYGVVQFVALEHFKARGPQTAGQIAGVIAVTIGLALWYGIFGALGITSAVAGVCGAYLADRTKSIGPVLLVTALGYVLFSVL